MTSLRVLYGQPRQGSVLIVVLVCLSIAMALIGASLRSALHERRALRTQLQLRQTELLLTAGIQRARLQLETAAEFTGETWELAPEAFSAAESAQVEINVTQAGEDLPLEVRVTARLSLDPDKTIQRSYTFSMEP